MSNYTKLKTNLKLSIQRLKLLEKKKVELSHKSRREIADYISINKPERARIRVEHIIREDNYVEALELLEMFCELLLARFGLIEKMKELDPGLDEAIATIIWSAPRISNDVAEFKVIGDILCSKYGKNYAEACKTDKTRNVNEKVKKRLGIEPPPKILVENYLIEIAKNFNVNYVPDPSVMLGPAPDIGDLINLGGNNSNNYNNNGGSGGFGASGGFIVNPGPPGSFNVDGSSAGIGFDQLTHNKSNGPNSNIIGSSSNQSNASNNKFNNVVLPVLPPPLPNTFPDDDDVNNNNIIDNKNNYDLSGNRNSLPPPYAYTPDRNNNNVPFDLSDPAYLKNALHGPIVVSDPNAPLPYKPGFDNNMHSPPPPVYQEKKPSPQQQQQQQQQQPVVPSAPFRTVKYTNLDDLPPVPTNDINDANLTNDEDDDVSFDDLQKRFNNLKKN